MSAKHTPTPWHTFPTNHDEDQHEFDIYPVNGMCIAEVGSAYGDEITAANAAFIIRAANSHEALVRALKSTLKSHDVLADMMRSRGMWPKSMDSATDEARATLTAAEDA